MTDGSSASCLEISDLDFQFGRRQILNRFSLQLDSGTIVRIDGPNGCGKTTLLDIVIGLRRPQAGQIRYSGRDITVTSVAHRSRLGIRRLRQRTRLFWDESAMQNVLAPWFQSGGTVSRDVELRAERMFPDLCRELTTGARAHTYSYGIKRAVAFVQAVFPAPKLLLLDEPFAGLSRQMREWMASAIRSRVDNERLAVLLVDHEHADELQPDRSVGWAQVAPK